MHGWIDGCMDRGMNGWMDAWMDAGMDEWSLLNPEPEPKTLEGPQIMSAALKPCLVLGEPSTEQTVLGERASGFRASGLEGLHV